MPLPLKIRTKSKVQLTKAYAESNMSHHHTGIILVSLRVYKLVFVSRSHTTRTRVNLVPPSTNFCLNNGRGHHPSLQDLRLSKLFPRHAPDNKKTTASTPLHWRAPPRKPPPFPSFPTSQKSSNNFSRRSFSSPR